MDDTISRSSLDSLSMGDEYVMVNAEPRLKIADNGDIQDLEKKLSEVLCDDNSSTNNTANTIGHSGSSKNTPMGDRANMVEIKVEADNKKASMDDSNQKDHVVNKNVISGVSNNDASAEKKAESKSPSSEEESGEKFILTSVETVSNFEFLFGWLVFK